jgi:hypothetical protein
LHIRPCVRKLYIRTAREGFMKKILTVIFSVALLLGSIVFSSVSTSAASMGFNPQIGYLKRKTKKVAHRTKTGTEYVAHKTKVGTKKTYYKTKYGSKKAYAKTKRGTKKTYVKTKEAVKN